MCQISIKLYSETVTLIDLKKHFRVVKYEKFNIHKLRIPEEDFIFDSHTAKLIEIHNYVAL